MNISKEEIKKEEKYLEICINIIKDYLSELGQELYEKVGFKVFGKRTEDYYLNGMMNILWKY